MKPEQFAYWLQGFVEISKIPRRARPTMQEWQVIKDHLATVFKKETPFYGEGSSIANVPYITPIC